MKVKNNNAVKSNYSFRNRIFNIISLTFLFFFIILIWISSYFTNVLREKTYNNIKDTLELYNHQLTKNLDDLDIFLFDMNSYSSDITQITSSKDLNTIYNHIMRAKDLLNYSRPSFTEIDGLFLYAPINDTFIQSCKYKDSLAVSSYLKSYLRELNSQKSLDQVNIDTWFSKEINHSYYLIRIIRIANSYLGAWANVDRLTSTFENISELDGNVIYVDSEGNPLCENELAGYHFDIDKSLNKYDIFKMNDKSKALLVSNEIDYCDYYLLAIIPLKNIDIQLDTIYKIFFLIISVIIVLTLLLMISVSKFLSKPLLLLENAATSLRSGNFDNKIPENISNCKEIIEIDTAFNHMVDEIHNLRIDIYEEKIAKSQIELQYLKSQIAPHFLINCLYSISTLVENNTKKQSILQKMVQTLSDHLRYTLSDRTMVALKEELMYIENYIELTKLRFPGCLSYITSISPETTDASVFPLILLMLTENTIKYNMVMGEPLQIMIISEMITFEDKKWIHLVHIDTGDGFSTEVLNTMNEINSTKQYHSDGSHLGIRNVAKRLELVYGENAKIRFSNEPEAGARIDIDIPYIPY